MQSKSSKTESTHRSSKPAHTGMGLFIVIMTAFIFLSVLNSMFFIFGAAGALAISGVAAMKVFKAISKVGNEASKKYSPAVRYTLGLFSDLVGVGVMLVTILAGIVAFLMAFFTAHPIRS